MKKNIIISLALGAILSTLTLYFAFRNVPFVDLMSYLTSINYFWIIPAILFSLFTFVLRVIRWQIILASVRKIDFWRAFHPLMIGFMINCILPGRVGEVARPLILKKTIMFLFPLGWQRLRLNGFLTSASLLWLSQWCWRVSGLILVLI